MTIVEKQDLSAASDFVSDRDKKSPSGPGPVFIEPDVSPPSYAETTDPRSQPVNAIASGSGSGSALPSPSNNVMISKSNQALSGVWVIDTEMKIPSDLLAKNAFSFFQCETARPNLELSTSNGSVKATVMLVSGSSARAKIKLGTSNGRVQFQMPSRTKDQPFQLSIKTSNASITVGIPRSYCGPLKFKTSNAKINLSEGLKAVTMMFSGETAFVGSWQEAGFKDYASWAYDEVEATTSNASINFYYNDELEARGPSFDEKIEGTVKSVLGWFGMKA